MRKEKANTQRGMNRAVSMGGHQGMDVKLSQRNHNDSLSNCRLVEKSLLATCIQPRLVRRCRVGLCKDFRRGRDSELQR